MTRLKMRSGVGIGTAAVMAAVAATSAQATDTLKFQLGVRETATTAAIGDNGGGTGTIDFVNPATSSTLIADGTWQQLSFHFGTDPVSNSLGVGNGVLSSSNMKGTLEDLLILNSSSSTSAISLYIDDIVLQVNASSGGTALGTYTLADFESPVAVNTAEYFFRAPGFSGSNSGVAGSPNVSKVVDTATTDAHGGTQSDFINFRYSSPSTSSRVRLTTASSVGKPNPTIDFATGNVLTFWAKATFAPPTMFWNADADGDWWDTTKWSNYPTEPIPGQATNPTTGAGADTARFLGAITAAHTVNVSQDTYLNQLLVDNANSYTFQSSPGGPGLIMTSTSSNPTAGTATIAVINGTHNVNADIYLNSSLGLSTAGTAVLNIGNTIDLFPNVAFSATPNPQIVVTKDGTGTANIHDLKYGYLVVSNGTLSVADGAALNLVYNESGTTPQASPRQALFVQSAGTLNLTNTSPNLTYRFTNTSTSAVTDVTGSIFNDGTINMSGGTLNTFRITISSTRGNLNLSNGAALNVTRYLYGAGISVADSSITIGSNGGTGTGGGVSNLGDLTITGTGYYEVNNNDMVINNDGLSVTGLADKIRGYLASGYNGGNWNGVGIRSAAANADPNHVTALGYATGADLFGAGTGSFSGFGGIKPTTVVVKYTYYGDANLDGKVNADDFALIDRGAAKGLTGWVNGDFDYDGTITPADYLLIDTAFGHQSGALSPGFLAQRESQFGAEYVAQLVASVPEPTTLSLVGLAGLGMLGRRRRCS